MGTGNCHKNTPLLVRGSCRTISSMWNDRYSLLAIQ
jgi:hypothetical protein